MMTKKHYNILIRQKRTLCVCGKTKTFEMTTKQQIQLNNYLNKYFKWFWQEIE